MPKTPNLKFDNQFEQRNPEIESLLKEIGTILVTHMPSGFGFSLLIFSYGEGGNLFYISSAHREDIVKTMIEFIEKQGYLVNIHKI